MNIALSIHATTLHPFPCCIHQPSQPDESITLGDLDETVYGKILRRKLQECAEEADARIVLSSDNPIYVVGDLAGV